MTITIVTSVVRLISIAIVFAAATNSAGADAASNCTPLVIKDNEICSTPACADSASSIVKNMNAAIDPCDDFYEFACGGYGATATIPDDKPSVDMYTVIEDEIEKELKTGLEEPSPSNELKALTVAKNLYKSCINETAIEAAGFKPLLDILGKLGNWPVLAGDNWKQDAFSWTNSIYTLRKLGYPGSYFIEFFIGTDLLNSTKHTLSLYQARLTIDRDYLIKGVDDENIKAYFDVMVDIAVMLGADKQRATQELKESLEFETKLAKIIVPNDQLSAFDSVYHPMTIAELQKQHPSVNWTEYINNMLSPSVRVDDKEIVIVEVLSYFNDLEALLKNTSKRVQANYLSWRVVGDSIDYLNAKIRNRQSEFTTKLYGQWTKHTRSKECLDIVTASSTVSIGALYVRKYFDRNAKKPAVQLMDDIRYEFKKVLQQAAWMDEKTRAVAMKKLAAMYFHIAYPDELFNDDKLNQFYASVKLKPDDFFGNNQKLNLFDTARAVQNFRKTNNKNDWVDHSDTMWVNAWYTFSENSIKLPAGILQGILFNKDTLQCINYGATGWIVGHEITHGFDLMGSQIDADGNLVDWWEPKTRETFLKKADCMLYQYGNYTDNSTGLALNGALTIGENIADNGGLGVAYRAYLDWVGRNGTEHRLPGLDYTPKQLFWISAANSWCTKYRLDALKNRIKTNPHPPAKFRVLGPFSNHPEFAADFNCPVGSTMNPKEKCAVW